MEFAIQLTSVQDVQNFVSLATACSFPIVVSDGNHRVDGKCFMEMFSLNMLRPLTVYADCAEGEFWQLKAEADCFLVY